MGMPGYVRGTCWWVCLNMLEVHVGGYARICYVEILVGMPEYVMGTY